MTQVLSKPQPTFDISAESFRSAARDLGEVLAMLAGGVKPDPESLSRLGLSMRLLQGFLLDEAEEQEGRESVAGLVSFGFDGNGSVAFPAPPPFMVATPVAEVA